jgi:putative SOS response-associated peptidase YedK
MLAYPVSTRVNNPKNDDPELLSPAGSLPDLQS